MLNAGDRAPDFELCDQDGVVRRLSDYSGKRLIVYFYPKDSTAGCTKQACGFTELLPQIREKGADVVGISRDSAASHKKFREKYGLGFTLLSDPDRKAIEAYGVWQEKKNYGKVSMGIGRSSFLVDENGVIEKAVYGAKAAENPAQMLKALG